MKNSSKIIGHQPSDVEPVDNSIYDFEKYPPCIVKAAGNFIIVRIWRVSPRTKGGIIKLPSVREQEEKTVNGKPVLIVSVGHRCVDHDPNIVPGVHVYLTPSMAPVYLPDITTGHAYYAILPITSVAGYTKDSKLVDALVREAKEIANVNKHGNLILSTAEVN